MIMLVRVRLPVAVAVLMTGHGIRAVGMRVVAHGPRMPGKPSCSTCNQVASAAASRGPDAAYYPVEKISHTSQA